MKKEKSKDPAGKPEEKKSFDKQTAYPLEEAVKLTKQFSRAKFDASIEAHLRLGIDPRKGDQQVRLAVSLPHGTGKSIRIAAFVAEGREKECKEAGADLAGGDDLIAQIKNSEKTDFQVAVAEPSMMKNLSQIAKILGTRGLMPNPKNETVTKDPVQAIKDLKKGKISFKNDDTANIHAAIGKISFKDEQIIENMETLINAVKKAKPSSSKGTYIKNIVLSSTMGPGIKVQIPK